MKIFLALLILASACNPLVPAMGDGDSYIQGTWRLAGGLSDENDGPRAWLLEWNFRNGEFVQTGYPPIRQSGRYEILEEDGKRLKLRLFDQNGTFGVRERVIGILIDRENARLSIDGKDGFERIDPVDSN